MALVYDTIVVVLIYIMFQHLNITFWRRFPHGWEFRTYRLHI